MTDTFHEFNTKIQTGFFSLGTSLLDAIYKGTLFDSGPTIHKPEEDEDNFDIVLETAEKISIIRPLLRPEILLPLLSEIRKHCKVVLHDVLQAFIPVKNVKRVAIKEEKKELPDWLKKFIPIPQEDDNNQDCNDIDAAENDAESAPNVKVKKRLIRRPSDFDKVKKIRIEPNQERNSMVEKAKCIFNIIIDTKSDGLSVANTLSHLAQFEVEWEKFPFEQSARALTSGETVNRSPQYSTSDCNR